jgi:protein TonB
MKQTVLRYVWGIVAVGLYLLLIGLLIFYFNHKERDEKKRYVKKDEHRIQVALSSPQKKVLPKKKNPVKPKPKPKPKPKKVTKPIPTKKPKAKKVIKEKVVKKVPKKRDQNLTKPKKQKKKARDLFKNVQTKKKPLIKVSDKPVVTKPKKQLFKMTQKRPSASDHIRSSLKQQKQMDSGVENAYLARVQEMLEGWPAQSDFAGEKVKVHLKIDPTGHFEFVIKRKSANPNFNQALTEYLQQLQEFGFGPHKGSRTYLFEAEFIAKE